MLAIRNYAALCIPSSIEAEVNLAVKKSQPDVKAADPTKGKPPTVTNGNIALRVASYGVDSNTKVLTDFVRPGGVLNQANLKVLDDYLQKNNLPSWVMFVNGAQFADQRDAAVKSLGLK